MKLPAGSPGKGGLEGRWLTSAVCPTVSLAFPAAAQRRVHRKNLGTCFMLTTDFTDQFKIVVA